MNLKGDRSLFSRLMMVCKGHPGIDIKEAIGLYGFTVVPRSLFAGDKTMMHCSCKSMLMHIFEEQRAELSTSSIGSGDVKVAIVDGMADVQSLDKPDWIKTCKDLAEHFITRVFVKYHKTQQIRLIFYRNDVLSSFKSATRSKRQGTEEPIYYTTSRIELISLKFSYLEAELTAFLAQKVMKRGEATGKQIIVAWATECKATQNDVWHLQSNHKEADTKIILHALDATADGAMELLIYSPDMDVLVLAVRHYPEMCPNTSLVTGSSTTHRIIKVATNCRSTRISQGSRTTSIPCLNRD